MSIEEQTEDELLLVTFKLGQAAFGIDAKVIQEIVKPGELTNVHHAPEYVSGIRNLRGKIVTVINLASLLELADDIEISPDNRIMIMDWKSEPLGFLVEEITEAISTSKDALLPPPANLHGVQKQDLLGVVRKDEKLTAVLDLDRLMANSGRGKAEKKD